MLAVPGVLLTGLLASHLGASGRDFALWWLYSAPLLLSTWFVNAALVAAVADVVEGRAPRLERAYRRVVRCAHRLLAAGVIELVALVALALTVVGLPLAIYFAVRWAFVQQRIVLRDDGVLAAFAQSSRASSGAWWRTFGILLALTAIAAIPVFVFGGVARAVSVVTGEAFAAIMTAAAQPFTAGAVTLLYLGLEPRKESYDRPT